MYHEQHAMDGVEIEQSDLNCSIDVPSNPRTKSNHDHCDDHTNNYNHILTHPSPPPSRASTAPTRRSDMTLAT